MTAGFGADEARIVVGVDGSGHSLQALRWGADLAAIFHARIDAVTAWDYPALYGWSAIPSDWDPARDMQIVLDDSVRAVFGGEPPAGLRRQVREGGAAKVLLDACRGTLMLVVGSRGHGVSPESCSARSVRTWPSTPLAPC